ncbi:MAG: cation:proton antiporter [Hyphomicrobiaceae bacterium]
MAGIADVAQYKDALIVLTTAAVIVPVVRGLKISPVIAYLVAGVVLGPNGIALLAPENQVLHWLTIAPDNQLGLAGELGVVFLLFLIGLELSFQRLVTMRRLVFGLGSLQIVLSATAIGVTALVLGVPAAPAVIIGLSLALSSTAIVIELLAQQQRLATTTGRTSFAVLLMQDLAVVPLILLVSVLAGNAAVSIVTGIFTALTQAVVALVAVAGIGWLALRPLFRHVAATQSQELFVAATLLVIVASGLVTGAAGLSMALGAFISGLLLAETEFRRAIQATIEPVKGLLLGVFFFTVGMKLDTRAIVADPGFILLATAALIVGKAMIVTGLLMAFRISAASIPEVALLLGSGGEFAYIIVGLALAGGIVDAPTATVVFAVTTLSMLLIPLLDVAGRAIAGRLTFDAPIAPELLATPDADAPPRAIIIGFGRVGQLISEMLEEHGIRYLAIEHDPSNVTPWRHRGRPVYYGDARDDYFLRQSGIAQAEAVLITINSPSIVDDIVRHVRGLNAKIVVVARARDAAHARHLYEIGASDAVPETIEASLQLAEASLVGLGVPTGPVIASIHGKRDEIRESLGAHEDGSGGYAGQAGRGSARHAKARAERPSQDDPA